MVCDTNQYIAMSRYSQCIVIQIHNNRIELTHARLKLLKMADHSGHAESHSYEFIKQCKCHPSSRSKIWKYFGFLTNDNSQVIVTPNKAICELCDEHVKCSNNTTNLLTHLKRHHFIQHEEIISEIRKEGSKSVGNSSTTLTGKQQSLMEMILRKEAYKRDSARYAACQSALVFFICDDLQPIGVIDSPAFHQLLHTLDPRFLPYSRSQFSRVIIPQKYDEVRHTVKQALDGAEYLSLTTDLWTGCHNRRYMSLSVHFVSSDWDMGHYSLQTREVLLLILH